MKIFIIVIAVGLVGWIIASWIAVRSLEEPKYETLSKESGYEIRNYESYIIAETVVSGSYDRALSQGFRNIADYIFGNNTADTKIAMTVPVAEDAGNTARSEKIAMTVPVINQGSNTERRISFVMPSKYTLENIPKPNTDRVELREIPARKVAVLKYSWYTNEKRVAKKAEELLQDLQNDNVTVVGQYSSARYNPPFSIPFLLRNEIIIELK